ncbi:Ig-like domain-containing protein, partial [Leptospira borgpetersenii serovar Hardjo-bovis]|nr:Ig-like domain-containing protein [Leptospira borgpetersenii serovar Hardjo-bovis]
TISSVTANPTSIVDDGVSSSTITATVVNGSGQPISGVPVNWTTTLGTLSVPSSVTGSDGTASTQLTDNGAPGTATVTATITGDSKFADVIVSESTAGYVISSLTSDKDSIA